MNTLQPLIPAAVPAVPAAPAANAPSTEPLRILLIDDSRTMRSIQKTVLARLGTFHIDEAADGQDALSRLAVIRPNLILVDWSMPVMDGVTFVRALRATGNDVPVIMVTTESERSKVLTAIAAGVDDYVVKPFTPELLARRIAEMLARVAPPAPTAPSV